MAGECEPAFPISRVSPALPAMLRETLKLFLAVFRQPTVCLGAPAKLGRYPADPVSRSNPSIPCRRHRFALPLRSSLGLAVGLACLVTENAAAAETVRRRFDIPAGEATSTLKQFLAQAGAHVLYSPDDVSGVRTHAVQGEFPPLSALTRMLAGTPLRAREDPSTNALSITRSVPPRALPGAPRNRPLLLPLSLQRPGRIPRPP